MRHFEGYRNGRGIGGLGVIGCFLFLLVGSAMGQELQWEGVGGPEGGSTLSLISTPEGVLYAGTKEGGVYRSEDGENWVVVGQGLPVGEVRGLSVTEDGLFAALFARGVFRLAPGAEVWEEMEEGLRNKRLLSLEVAGGTLFAGTDNGIYASDSGGETWVELGGDLQTYRVYSFLTVGETLYTGTSYHGVYRSADGGASWESIGENLDNKTMYPLVTGGGYFFASVPGLGIYRRGEGESRWVRKNDGMPENNSVLGMVLVDGILMAGSGDGYGKSQIYRSDDWGESWQELGEEMPKLRLTAMVEVEGQLYTATEGDGVYRSEDGGQSWSPANAGLAATAVTGLIETEDGFFAGVLGGGVHYSPGIGERWQPVRAGLDDYNVTSLVAVESVLLAGVRSGAIYRSVDRGESWVLASAGIEEDSRQVNALVVAGSTVLAGTGNGGVYYSVDQGDNWIRSRDGLLAIDVASLQVVDDVIYLGTYGHGAYRSDDGGLSWRSINRGLGNSVWARAIIAADPYIYLGGTSGVYRSGDGGENWTKMGTVKRPTQYVTSLAVFGGAVYAGTQDDGLFRLDPIENRWVNDDAGLSNIEAAELSISDGYLYAATRGRGVMRAALPEEAPAGVAEIVLSSFGLDFGSLPIGEGGVQGMAVSNPGTEPLYISAVQLWGEDRDEFSVRPVEMVVQPGAEDSVWVTFTPMSAGVKGASISFVHNGARAVNSVLFSGTATGELPQLPPVELQVSEGRGRPGDQVEVTIEANRATHLAGGDLVLSYNPILLRPLRVEGGMLAGAGRMTLVANLEEREQVRIAMAGATASRLELGSLVRILFEIRPEAHPGLTTLSLAAVLKDEEGQVLPSTSSPGGIDVVVGLSGDLDDDGQVSAADAIQVLRHAVGLEELVGLALSMADVNGDGGVDAGDAVLILRMAVGLIDSFPESRAAKPLAGVALELGEPSPISGGGIELPIQLAAGVGAGELVLVYDPALGEARVESPDDVLLVADARSGRLGLSLIRAETGAPVTILVRLREGDVGAGYRVQGRLFDGEGNPLGGVDRTVRGLPVERLQVYPNPANPSTQLRYSLNAAGAVRLTVYSATGQQVRELVSEWQEVGGHTASWDGRDQRGREVASGLYLVRLKAGEKMQTQKIALIR